ncbi:MAG TPA: hypothetical protein VM513_02355 [Kofleriaceae bacterium]|nr:hypothetical protein [Kofleriaceae bacterium]
MRTHLIALMALAACEKTPTKAAPAKGADALWALAPAKLQAGVVITPRALDLLEGGALRVQSLVQTAPELGFLKARLDEVTGELGDSFKALADVGLDKTRGFAWFADEADNWILVVPVADRAKLGKLAGEDLGTDPNKLGKLVCKTSDATLVCATTDAALAAVGKGTVPAEISAVGARGDIEGVGRVETIAMGAVIQLERGELVARVTVSGVPGMWASQLAGKAKPRVEGDRSVAFLSMPIALLAQRLPGELPLPGGGTAGELFASVNGPLTLTIDAGSNIPDVRVPVGDPAPAQRLVDNCKELIPADMLAATQTPGTCRFKVPQYALELDAWIDGKEVRIGAKHPAATGKTATLTALGSEIAAKEWTTSLWGRGTMLGASEFPGMDVQQLPDEAAATVRALSLLSELGVAVRADGDKVSGVLGVRTVFANPDDVVRKVLAISPVDIIAGTSDVAKAIAAGAPGSPFAKDFDAGQGGLMVPTAVVGMVAAVAIPAFMMYRQRSLQPEPTTPQGNLMQSVDPGVVETPRWQTK